MDLLEHIRGLAIWIRIPAFVLGVVLFFSVLFDVPWLRRPAPTAPVEAKNGEQGTPPAPIVPERPVREQIDLGDELVATSETTRGGQVRGATTTIDVSQRGARLASLTVHVLFDAASWEYGSARNAEDGAGQPIDLQAVLDQSDFAVRASDYDHVIAVGLSSSTTREEPDTLSRARAISLCAELYQKSYVDLSRTRVFALPLGHEVGPALSAGSSEERRQRTVVIVGVRKRSGTISELDLVRRVISRFRVPDVDLRRYSRVNGATQLEFVEICNATRGARNP